LQSEFRHGEAGLIEGIPSPDYLKLDHRTAMLMVEWERRHLVL
jgi:hypothetical protein